MSGRRYAGRSNHVYYTTDLRCDDDWRDGAYRLALLWDDRVSTVGVFVVAYNDQQKSVIVEGLVVGEPDARDAYTNLRVEANKLIIADQPTRTVEALALIQTPPFTDFRYGDRIRAEGTRSVQTSTNTSEFDYREYLARQDVYLTPHLRRVQVSCRAHA
jgi:hypothetical protein